MPLTTVTGVLLYLVRKREREGNRHRERQTDRDTERD